MDIKTYFSKQIRKIDKALNSYLPKAGDYPPTLCEAMRYAVFSGGKRIRPILTLAACEAVGGNERVVMPAACALELIHSYSLVHDDLPCMDDDDERRGQLTCHKKFGEETALLAGDALLTLAFKILSRTKGAYSGIKHLKRQIGTSFFVAEAVGACGMVGGQQADIEFRHKDPNLATIDYINTHKTGSLIAASVRTGAYLGGGTPKQVEALLRYGRAIGLLFQIVDDIIDREGYARVVGLLGAKEKASELLSKAKKELKPLGQKAVILEQIGDFILARKS